MSKVIPDIVIELAQAEPQVWEGDTPSFRIAQIALETGWFTSFLFLHANNWGGIKAAQSEASRKYQDGVVVNPLDGLYYGLYATPARWWAHRAYLLRRYATVSAGRTVDELLDRAWCPHPVEGKRYSQAIRLLAAENGLEQYDLAEAPEVRGPDEAYEYRKEVGVVTEDKTVVESVKGNLIQGARQAWSAAWQALYVEVAAAERAWKSGEGESKMEAVRARVMESLEPLIKKAPFFMRWAIRPAAEASIEYLVNRLNLILGKNWLEVCEAQKLRIDQIIDRVIPSWIP